ncbi:Legume lectin domain [Sesbania bispinosa]|nr:Legume lectin domain [Sesbania bispinosa]
MILVTFLLLIITKVKSEFSFIYPDFRPEAVSDLVLTGDATISGGALQLTKKDASGNPIQNTVGLCTYNKAFRLYNRNTGELADFTTGFDFVANAKSSKLEGDGMTFFIASSSFHIPSTDQSGGGFLGLFTPDTAFDPSKNQIVAIEFDSFTNEWDPSPQNQIPHIGVDVNTIKSEAVVLWGCIFEPQGTIGRARISYDSKAKQLVVSVTYPQNNPGGDSSLTYNVDLTSVLPEQVVVGFSAASGGAVETHDILSWFFSSTL